MGHPHPPLGLMDILEVESCRMKTAVGLGLVKGSANQPLSQTTGLLRQSLVGRSGQGHSLPCPAAFDGSLSPHALRVPQVRPPGSPADEIETQSDPKHRGKEGLFKGSKQETGGDANTELSLLPRREGRLSLCGSRCHPDAQDPWSPPHALRVHLDKTCLSNPRTEVIILVSDFAQNSLSYLDSFGVEVGEGPVYLCVSMWWQWGSHAGFTVRILPPPQKGEGVLKV